MALQATLKMTPELFENGVSPKDLARILQNREVRQWIMRAPYSSIGNEDLYAQIPEYHEADGRIESVDELMVRVVYEHEFFDDESEGELLDVLVYLVGKDIWDISKRRALIDLTFDIEEPVLGLTDSFSFEVRMHNDESYEPDPSFELARELSFYINEYMDLSSGDEEYFLYT